MTSVIYVEKAIRQHFMTQRILKTIGKQASIVECEHYGEIFNRKSQNFRIQKQNPALILAKKTGQLVLRTPKGFGIGGANNYYFSHMLNCPYDCRYCFLQGLYSSAHYVVFINYDDFMGSIDDVISQHRDETIYFFSGYDNDSLAYEPVTQFTKTFIPFFENKKKAILELRTKSVNIRQLMQFSPNPQIVVAYSLSPDSVAEQVEHKAPTITKRLQALQKLSQAGWLVGIRLDPLIYSTDYQKQYQYLIERIFASISIEKLHSVSLGPLRFPGKMYQKITKLYPDNQLLAHPLYQREGYISYREEIELAMKEDIIKMLSKHIDETLLFECALS